MSYRYAVVDLEATGSNPDQGAQIIQIGAVIVEDGQIVHEYSMMINPQTPIPMDIAQLTGLSDDLLAKAPNFESVASLWYERLKDCVFVAHNLAFDLSFLQYYFKQYLGVAYQPRAFDTVTLAKVIAPTSPGFNLTDLGAYYGRRLEGAHDALADARMTTYVLSSMAEEFCGFSEELKSCLLEWSRRLDHDEADVFDQPERYILDLEAGSLTLPQDESLLKPLTTLEQLLVDYLEETLASQAHRVIEDRDHPLSLGIITQLAATLSDKQAVTLSLSNEALADQLTAALRSPSSALANPPVRLTSKKRLLHQEKFLASCQSLQPSSLNLNERILVMAVYRWLEMTEFGYLSELNPEFKVNDFLDKYQTQQTNHRHHLYERMLRAAEQAEWIVTDHFTHHGYLSEAGKYDFLLQRHLISDNVFYFDQSLRRFASHRLPLSELYLVLEPLASEPDDLGPAATWAESSLTHLEAILADLTQAFELSQLGQPTVPQQRTLSLYVADSLEMVASLAPLRSDLERLLADLESSSMASIKRNLHQLKVIKAAHELLSVVIRDVDQSEYYLRAFVQQIGSHLFDFHLWQEPLILSDSLLLTYPKLAQITQCSPGNYHQYQQFCIQDGSSAFSYQYCPLPRVKSRPLMKMWVPVEDHHGSSLQFMLERRLEEGRHKALEHHLILTNNQDEVHRLYNEMRHSPAIQGSYMILAQSLTGSMNRIRRKVQENTRTIIIVQQSTLLKADWAFSAPVSIYIQRLPFMSPNQPYNQALIQRRLAPGTNDFEALLLPQMIRRFKELLQFIQDRYHIERLFLWDQRIFSKYYSQTVREALSSIVDFEIYD